MKARQFPKRYSISIVFLWLLAWVYLLFPTSAPLTLNGLPLDRKSELLVFIALTLTALLACVLRYLILIGFVPLPDRQHLPRFQVYLEIAAIVIVLTLLIFKPFYPESNQLTSCFEIPDVNEHPCVWLPEGFRIHQPDLISRFEESITFAAPEKPWRLASFNDVFRFGFFDSPEGTLERKLQDLRPERPHERRIQELRKSRSYPFSATFHLGEPIARLLRQEYEQDEKISLAVKYTGGVDVSGDADRPVAFPYSETEQTQLLDVPASRIPNLVIRYRNFRCADETQTASQCARALTVVSLPLEAARLDVAVIHPEDGKRISLGYAPLLARSRGRNILMAFGFLENLAGAIAVLILLIRIYPYFSSVPKNVTQFASEARQHLPAIFQIILIGTLGALAIRTLYRFMFPIGVLANGVKLTILLPLGAAYVSLFWMVLFSKRAHQFFKAALATLGPGAALVAFSPFLIYLGLTLCIRVAPMNEVSFLTPGDDPLAYATDAMGILENGSPRNLALPFTHFLVKPLFLYSRALYYAIFGGGETYYSILITTAFVCVWSLVMVLWVLAPSTSVNAVSSSWKIRIGIAAACAIAYVTLGKTFLANGGVFAGQPFSEGPAWLFGLASFALLVALPTSSRPALTLRLIGLLFTASLCFRMQNLMFLPLLVFVCAFLRRDLALKKIVIGVCSPVAIVGAVLFLLYLSHLPTTGQSKKLFRVGSLLGKTPSRSLLVRQARLLFPSYWELLCTLTVLALLVWNWFSKGAKKRLVFLSFAYVATIFVLDGLITDAAYYPRHIIMAFFLSSCAAIALIQNLFLADQSPATRRPLESRV